MNRQNTETHPVTSTASVPTIDMFSLYAQIDKISTRSEQGSEAVIEDTRDDVDRILDRTGWKKKILRQLPDREADISNKTRKLEMFQASYPSHLITLSEEILEFQNQIMARAPELWEAGIVHENGIWYFAYLKTRGPWSRIDGWFFQTFPSPSFNIRHKIGNARWHIKDPLDISRLFTVLWLRIATFEEEKARFANLIRGAEWDLLNAWIIHEDGVWYFGDARWTDSWPEIQGRPLKRFPNVIYNQDHKIGNQQWVIQAIDDISRLFRSLWLTVATQAEEEARWARILSGAKQELESIRVVEEQGIWYLGDARWNNLWPKIQGKSLSYFPNATFTKDCWLAHNNRGQLTNANELAKLFTTLGLRVATPAEEKSRWARMITEHENDFKNANIFRKNGVWDFSKARWHTTWPTIYGRCLVNFPNSHFKMTHNIWNTHWHVTDAWELTRLFRALGLRVKSPVAKDKKK